MDETMYTAAFWNERYQNAHRLWSGKPNHWLTVETEGLAPGTALDAGCGEGGDAQWLARRGWLVTAVDTSSIALHRAAANTPDDIADRITWLEADLRDRTTPAGTFDLVTSHFLHFPGTMRDSLIQRLAGSVAHGGRLLVVGHDASDVHSGVGRPDHAEVYFDAEELATLLRPDQWRVVTAESRPRMERMRDRDEEVVVRDAILHAQRLPAN
ncbi:MAG TPA: class I SAM-dependent methyltransferase [Pseudonocardia sp.]|jgi:SAM-dependent methyltransferase|nr:class I SAM-dependent methyltransferase [Pseudonocardia sp.]